MPIVAAITKNYKITHMAAITNLGFVQERVDRLVNIPHLPLAIHTVGTVPNCKNGRIILQSEINAFFRQDI